MAAILRETYLMLFSRMKIIVILIQIYLKSASKGSISNKPALDQIVVYFSEICVYIHHPRSMSWDSRVIIIDIACPTASSSATMMCH